LCSPLPSDILTGGGVEINSDILEESHGIGGGPSRRGAIAGVNFNCREQQYLLGNHRDCLFHGGSPEFRVKEVPVASMTMTLFCLGGLRYEIECFI